MKEPNPVFQKAALFKQLWEEKHPTETFALIPMVFRWAKELIEIDNDMIVERFKIFAEDEWYWENTRHSLPAFVKNFNSFVPKVRRRDGTIARREPMPIARVQKLFEPFVEKMSAEKKATDPNEKFRCTKCNTIHSPNADCQERI
jgi:hypothetical protein